MAGTPIVLKIHPRDPETSRIREAAEACRADKMIVFPTETVYGVGGCMSSPEIEKKLREMKGRSDHKPFAYHIGDWEMVDLLKVPLSPMIRFMVRHFWPGPVTFVVRNEAGQKIGVRFPKNKIARAFINQVKEPLIATSANRSGQPSPHTAPQALEQLKGVIDYVIDGGKTELAMDSTVVDLTTEVPVILRQGAHHGEVEKAIERVRAGKYPRKRILVICTGNSCRSPMAEGWLRHELERKDLLGTIEVVSCGTNARDGLPASSEAEFVMRNHEIDISRHQSRHCQKEDLWGADLILAMATQHEENITELLAAAKNKTIVLDVPDPIGMGMSVYETTLYTIQTKMKLHMSEITKLH